MKFVFFILFLLPFTCAQSGEVVPSVLEGDVTGFTKTDISVVRRIRIDSGFEPESIRVESPVFFRNGTLNLTEEQAKKLAALIPEIEEYTKKAELLKENGRKIVEKYKEAIKGGSPLDAVVKK